MDANLYTFGRASSAVRTWDTQFTDIVTAVLLHPLSKTNVG